MVKWIISTLVSAERADDVNIKEEHQWETICWSLNQQKGMKVPES